MKNTLLAIAGAIIIAVEYTIFVADRIIIAPFPRSIPSFFQWKNKKYSYIRVIIVSLLLWLLI